MHVNLWRALAELPTASRLSPNTFLAPCMSYEWVEGKPMDTGRFQLGSGKASPHQCCLGKAEEGGLQLEGLEEARRKGTLWLLKRE